jgi:hypothetical protein
MTTTAQPPTTKSKNESEIKQNKQQGNQMAGPRGLEH